LKSPAAGLALIFSPRLCVMTKRLRAGRGFVVRDLPWTVEKLRAGMVSSQRDNRKLARHIVSGLS